MLTVLKDLLNIMTLTCKLTRMPTVYVLSIVWLTVVNSTFVLLSGICAKATLTFFKCPTIANT